MRNIHFERIIGQVWEHWRKNFRQKKKQYLSMPSPGPLALAISGLVKVLEAMGCSSSVARALVAKARGSGFDSPVTTGSFPHILC